MPFSGVHSFAKRGSQETLPLFLKLLWSFLVDIRLRNTSDAIDRRPYRGIVCSLSDFLQQNAVCGGRNQHLDGIEAEQFRRGKSVARPTAIPLNTPRNLSRQHMLIEVEARFNSFQIDRM